MSQTKQEDLLLVTPKFMISTFTVLIFNDFIVSDICRNHNIILIIITKIIMLMIIIKWPDKILLLNFGLPEVRPRSLSLSSLAFD